MSKSKIKAGDVIETYQGRFFKVVEIKDGMYGRTGFHTKKVAAEGDDTVARYINAYGLSQLLQEGDGAGERAPKKAATAYARAKTAPRNDGEEETVKAITDMKVAELRELAAAYGLDTSGKQGELVARLTAHVEAEVADMTEHKVTQEDIVKYPILAEYGVKVGDAIYLPKEETIEESS